MDGDGAWFLLTLGETNSDEDNRCFNILDLFCVKRNIENIDDFADVFVLQNGGSPHLC